MRKVLLFIIVFCSILSCKENNCVPTALVVFSDLNEPDVDHYLYEHDALMMEIPSAVTPNSDGVNDMFVIKTNILASDFVAVDFKIKNGCDKTIHKQHGIFPFTLPDLENMEDGAYDFDFSIVLNDKHLITGAGVINIIRK
jgi:hypothetical protein